MELEERSLDTLVPYWRNPRRITDEAVNAVAESIRRYGYQQPIAVDEANVIVVGHTRYSALRRLGYTHAQVRVLRDLTPQQIKQLRLIDNRVAELTSWDFDSLMSELGDLDASLMQRFFPEVSEDDTDMVVEMDEMPWDVPQEVDDDPEPHSGREVEFVCPSCFNMWEQSVSKAQVLDGLITSKEKQDV